jgi:hypothetical protein
VAARRQARAAEVAEQAAMTQRIIDEADFRSWASFYEGNVARRGDDEFVRDVVDDEMRWRVCWIPRTCEVVAFAEQWVHPHEHPAQYRALKTGEAAFGSAPVVGVASVPELVELLGCTTSIDEARRRLELVATIADCRAALADSDRGATS